MLLASLALLPALQVWIVDPSGTGDFLDLPQAVAAASPGDTLVFAPGTYTPTTINKALNLIGPKQPTVFSPTATVGLVAGQGLVVNGAPELVITNMYLQSALLRNVPGRLRIDDVDGSAWSIVDCDDVLMTRSSILSTSSSQAALKLEDSGVQLQECLIMNADVAANAGDAIESRGQNEVLFVGGHIEGGSTPGYLPSEQAGSAFRVLSGHLDLTARGSKFDLIDGGGDWMGFSGPAIRTSGGTYSVVWSGIANTIGSIFEALPAEPYLEIGPEHNVTPTRRLRAFGLAGSPCFVVMTRPSNTILPTAWDGEPIRVDLNQILGQKLLLLQGQDTSASYSFTPPSGPGVIGADFDVQGVVQYPDGSLFITNASQVILIE